MNYIKNFFYIFIVIFTLNVGTRVIESQFHYKLSIIILIIFCAMYAIPKIYELKQNFRFFWMFIFIIISDGLSKIILKIDFLYF